MNENVYVTYIQVLDYLNKWEIYLIFEITTQIDYFTIFMNDFILIMYYWWFRIINYK